MKHQQIQLASKRNVIRLVALVAMLAVMACGMILSISAADAVESVTFAAESGIEFDSQTNLWVKTYDGQTEINPVLMSVKVNNTTVTVEKAEFDSANVADVTCITVTYDGGKTLVLPAAIKPAELTWGGAATVTVTYNATEAKDGYANKAVNVENVTLKDANGTDVAFKAPSVSFVAQDVVKVGDGVYAYAQVELETPNSNYVVAPLKVQVVVNPIAIETITWVGVEGPFTYGDDLTGIKALGNGSIPMVVTATATANACCL